MADLRNEDFNSTSSDCENSQNNQFSDLVIVELYHTGDDNELYIILQEEGTTEELIGFYPTYDHGTCINFQFYGTIAHILQFYGKVWAENNF